MTAKYRDDVQTENLMDGKVRVRITYVVDGLQEYREFADCYAFLEPMTGALLVRHYDDEAGMLPRVLYPAPLLAVAEHRGPHKVPQSRKAAVLPVKAVVAVAMGGPEAAGKMQHGMTPEEVVEESLNKAWAEFKQDSTPAQDQPDTKKFLESDYAAPKDESSTGEGSGSDPNMLETPSGKFLTKLPLETTEEEIEDRKKVLDPELKEAIETFGVPDEPNTLGPDMNFTPAPGSLDNRATRRAKKHGGHGRPKQLPGATALFALALSLSLLFRHTS